MAVNLDWTRDPPPSDLTAFQKLIRYVKWSDTALGPMSTWSRELRLMVRLMVADTSPTLLYWGDQRIVLYNEACIPMLGQKHPTMLGQKALDAYGRDVWGFFESIIQKHLLTGQAHSGQASRLLLARHGFLEETFFDWKLLPVVGDDGFLHGVQANPIDITHKIIGLRRNTCVQHLSQRLITATSPETFAAAIMETLAENEKDTPFAVLYSQTQSVTPTVASKSRQYRAVGWLSVPSTHRLRHHEIHLDDSHDTFVKSISEAAETSTTVIFDDSDVNAAKYLEGIDWQATGIPSKQFAAIPIKKGSITPAVLVVGLNPYRRYNDWYQSYLQMIADGLSSQLSNIALSEELQYRSELATQALRNFEKSETRFTRFAKRSIMGLAVADMQGKILYANDSWYNFSGFDPTKLDTARWEDTVHDDDKQMLQEWWYKVAVLKQNGSFQFRSKNPFKSGNMEMPYRTGICAAYADVDQDGIETIMGLIVDISEQKWIEGQLLDRSRELEASEEKYRLFAEHSPIGIVRTDSSGYVIFGNAAWHDYYGFTPGNVPDSQPWLAHLVPEDVPKCVDFFNKLATQRGTRTVDLRLKRKYTMTEGDRIIEGDAWVLATGLAEWTDDEEVKHVDFWVIEISAQKMAESILKDKMEEAIRTRKQQERFIDMISHEIRNPLSAVLHCGEEIVESMKQCLIAFDGKTPADALMAKRDPNVEVMEKMIYNALDAGNTIMYCVQHQKQIVDDVLTLSKLDSELLVVSPIPVQLTDFMHSCVKIFEPELRSSDITMKLRIDESITREDISWILLDPNRLSQILINLITNAIKFTRGSSVRKIDIRTSIHTTPPQQHSGLDYVPTRFKETLRRDSFVQSAKPEAGSELYLQIDVSDTGKGLTSGEKKLLFKRFAQASPKTEVSYGGSGLGLFISRQITEMLGGEIGVGSSPSGGCIFAFYVATSKIDPPENVKDIPKPKSSPAVTAADIPMSLAPESPKKLSWRPKEVKKTCAEENRKALVVEDNLVNQKVLCKQLRNRGFEVEATNHGKEALEALERATLMKDKIKSFDICLCDIEMPIMNGIECVKELRRLEDMGHFITRIPVIGVTANVRSKQVDAALEAGMDGITTKPYRIDDLVAHIDRLCPMVKAKKS